ncbi:hypothetical protein WR25_21402 [Diploscapter pachys]|uniref:Caspase family p20 domain-containing protein n=1 Tax=Diploscapter pachys TaxID=2018661 RepID=A0A2A2JCN5_9BILA|nr:hypothetical protein WR25_21402 [Diploscapter pachys]
MTCLTTNLADLPVAIYDRLAAALNTTDLWEKLIDSVNQNSPFYSSVDEVGKYEMKESPGEILLRQWGNRGQTVYDLLNRLQNLSKLYGGIVDNPQLILCRKYKPVRWTRDDHFVVSVTDSAIRIECKAAGFPTPRFIWYRNDEIIEGAEGYILEVVRCECSILYKYRCRVWNEVPEGYTFSEFYRRNGKQFSSSLDSDECDISSFTREDYKCDQCKSGAYDHLRQIMNIEKFGKAGNQPSEDEIGPLVAVDKVALIISNCIYLHLPELVTPLCDAETLAMALQDMEYKTVVLADLTLEEMKFVVREYRRLLGNGVYAVFYFVGHGFEVNGQCYLLPIDAPAEAYQPQNCLSMDWVLYMFRDYVPHLNLLILDVCRKFIPYQHIGSFVEYAEQFKNKNKPNRNVVYGYSTSGGVGAYEVRGEMNGVFMKYLKNYVNQPQPVLDMLNAVLRDIENDKKVSDMQIPEIRTTLTKPRSLTDQLTADGHTMSYEHHNIHWRLMHELPNPVRLKFEELNLTVTIWFDFCGHFTNKAYVFSSVGDLIEDETDDLAVERPLSKEALSHRAYLRFSEHLHMSKERVVEDDSEGVSLCWLLSHLQRCKGEMPCTVELKKSDDLSTVVATKEASLGHVLITRIQMFK